MTSQPSDCCERATTAQPISADDPQCPHPVDPASLAIDNAEAPRPSTVAAEVPTPQTRSGRIVNCPSYLNDYVRVLFILYMLVFKTLLFVTWPQLAILFTSLQSVYFVQISKEKRSENRFYVTTHVTDWPRICRTRSAILAVTWDCSVLS